MARVLITGSSDGLGLMAGELLARDGHEVTLHARNGARAGDARAALPAAGVTIKNIETGAERRLVTDAGGRYYAPSITVGRYEITASKEGFSSQTKTGIELVVGQSSVVACPA